MNAVIFHATFQSRKEKNFVISKDTKKNPPKVL